MKSRGFIKFRQMTITLLGVFCLLAALTSHFVQLTQTRQAAILINSFMAFFGIACFAQAYVLQSELNTRY